MLGRIEHKGRIAVQNSELSVKLRRLSWLIHAANVEAKVHQFTLIERVKYNPNQPRVPAGNPDGGQWTQVGSGAGEGLSLSRWLSPQERTQLVEVIRVCIISGVARLTDEEDRKTYSAIYDCFGGRTVRLRGAGHSPPGLVLDPLR